MRERERNIETESSLNRRKVALLAERQAHWRTEEQQVDGGLLQRGAFPRGEGVVKHGGEGDGAVRRVDAVIVGKGEHVGPDQGPSERYRPTTHSKRTRERERVGEHAHPAVHGALRTAAVPNPLQKEQRMSCMDSKREVCCLHGHLNPNNGTTRNTPYIAGTCNKGCKMLGQAHTHHV